MQDKLYVINARKLKIKVIPYLILEYMHYYNTHLNYFKPMGIGYIGIDKNLFQHSVKELYKLKFVTQKKDGNKGDFKLSLNCQKRLNTMLGSKDDYETLFKNQFLANYPNKSGVKAAKNAFMKIPLNSETNIIQDIVDGIEKRKKWESEAPEGSFLPSWPLPATYLNGERWKDTFIPWPKSVSNSLEYKPKEKERL